MGTVFRRSFHCKKTGKIKRVKGFSLKYKDERGRWVVEPTPLVRRPLAERLLLQREQQVQARLAGETPGQAADTRADQSHQASPFVLLVDLREQYLAAVRLRLKETTAKMYREVLS